MLFITGGDTLLGFLNEIGQTRLRPIAEVLPGCVLTEVMFEKKKYHVIAKSGGFGETNVLEQLVNLLDKQ